MAIFKRVQIISDAKLMRVIDRFSRRLQRHRLKQPTISIRYRIQYTTTLMSHKSGEYFVKSLFYLRILVGLYTVAEEVERSALG